MNNHEHGNLYFILLKENNTRRPIKQSIIEVGHSYEWLKDFEDYFQSKLIPLNSSICLMGDTNISIDQMGNNLSYLNAGDILDFFKINLKINSKTSIGRALTYLRSLPKNQLVLIYWEYKSYF